MGDRYSTSKARASRNRASKSGSGRSKPRIPTAPSFDRSAFREGLIKHIGTIRDAMYVVIVCCAASREQNADMDGEISSVLQRGKQAVESRARGWHASGAVRWQDGYRPGRRGDWSPG